MKLADAWRAIESELPAGWADARLRMHISDPTRLERAAAALGPLTPGRVGSDALVLTLRRASAASNLSKLLRRLDDEGIAASLELVGSATQGVAVPDRRRLAPAWDASIAELPDDWSDLLVQLELESSDHLARSALLLAPCNPTRTTGETKTLRFRCARRAGYGVSPGMAHRCFVRLDEDGIRGAISIPRVLSETDHVDTLGPVWNLAGRSV